MYAADVDRGVDDDSYRKEVLWVVTALINALSKAPPRRQLHETIGWKYQTSLRPS